MKSLGFLGLVFDTGLSVTPLMGHLGSLASHWSVPVAKWHSGTESNRANFAWVMISLPSDDNVPRVIKFGVTTSFKSADKIAGQLIIAS